MPTPSKTDVRNILHSLKAESKTDVRNILHSLKAEQAEAEAQLQLVQLNSINSAIGDSFSKNEDKTTNRAGPLLLRMCMLRALRLCAV